MGFMDSPVHVGSLNWDYCKVIFGIDTIGRFGNSLEQLIKDTAYLATSSVKERAFKTFQLRMAIAVAHAKALSKEQLTMLLHGQEVPCK